MELIYNYEPISNEFISASQPFIDERATEKAGAPVYLIPANATNIIPPKSREGYAVCFDEGNKVWNFIEDHRGQICYKKENLEEVTIQHIGPLPNDVLTELPQPENEYQIWKNGQFEYPEITELRQKIKTDLDSKYEKKINTPYAVNRFFVLPSWATIYTNTLIAMQQDLNEDGKLDEDYYILLMSSIKTQRFEQVKITEMKQFMPLYNKVKDTFKQLTTEYHDKIAILSTATNPNVLVSIIQNY